MRRTLAVAAVPDSLPLSQIQSQFPKSNLHSGESPPSSLPPPHPLPLRRRRPLSMQFVRGIVCGKASAYSNAIANFRGSSQIRILNFRFISNENDDSRDKFSWDSPDSWSTGLTKDHFDGEAVGHRVGPTIAGSGSGSGSGGFSDSDNPPPEKDIYYEFNEENRRSQGFVDGWDAKLKETSVLLNQVREPGARGSYLKDSDKAEMYRLHKENPEVYTIEKLAQDFRIMRQRVHAILWLKEIEEEEEKKLGHPLDDFVETLLDTFPEFFVSHDKEFHVASLPYKPDFKVMPEGWDGTTRDPDEVHYEISKKEDDMLYEEFVQKMNFNKMKMKGEVKVHKYSRRRPSDGWNFTVEKMGSRGKRGDAGGWKFVSQPDGSTRPLNDTEKMYVKRETPRRRRRILP